MSSNLAKTCRGFAKKNLAQKRGAKKILIDGALSQVRK